MICSAPLKLSAQRLKEQEEQGTSGLQKQEAKKQIYQELWNKHAEEGHEEPRKGQNKELK